MTPYQLIPSWFTSPPSTLDGGLISFTTFQEDALEQTHNAAKEGRLRAAWLDILRAAARQLAVRLTRREAASVDTDQRPTDRSGFRQAKDDLPTPQLARQNQ